MHKIISEHENASDLFDDGILANIKTKQVNPVQYIIDQLESRTDTNSIMILGLIDEAILHNMLYYTQDGIKHRYELI